MSQPSESHRQLTTSPQPASLQTSLSDAKARLLPASAATGNAELMACLTLVAPSGMTAEDRNAWIQVARATLSGMPADLLATGCKIARQKCRFASEIVPSIMESVGGVWEQRQRLVKSAEAALRPRQLTQRVEKKPEYIGAVQISKLIKSIGA